MRTVPLLRSPGRMLGLLTLIVCSGAQAVAASGADNARATGPSLAPTSPASAEADGGARARPSFKAAAGTGADLDADSIADAKAEGAAPVRTWDPWEPFNRAMFRLNDKLYSYAFRPFIHGYERVVPKPVRQGLVNAFGNVHFPIRFVGAVLRGRLRLAGQETAKFGINTILGVGGLVRVSDDVPALEHLPAEDLGLAFGAWGLRPGPYVVLPVLGPGDVRDLAGEAGEYFLNPMNWDTIHLGHITWISKPYRLPLQSLEFVSVLPDAIRTYDAVVADALDPYIAAREAFLSHRRAEGNP